MKQLSILIIVMMFGCGSKDCQEELRKAETINIIKDLLEQKEMNFVSDFPSKEELPICINLKKVIVKTNCFEELPKKRVVTITLSPKKTYITKDEICVELIYMSKPIKDGFFLVKDSSDMVHQNECFQSFTIPKSMLKNHKTVEYSKETTRAEKYIQFSIPIFSKDNKKAYLEFDHYSRPDSYGYRLYLEKVNQKWIIKDVQRGWNSCGF